MFSAIYVFSPSVHHDGTWGAIKKYVRDELYKNLDDHALVELWRKKKKGRLPPGSVTSGRAGNTNATYDRAVLLRKLQEAGIVPDESSDDDGA